ncbi:mRNA-degrading endonuclease [Virgibacillus phasianinus]|uniref:mRNA-degrading endonuclease n=1 Tax=Virgibacillus phasianinus TaxID=2017483 RepID=A0A220U2I8_9BACI|nr:endoribonuclease MazF [Virgibacillus phasianinus]ASK62255.1 mRNA-degrading endonuclease [Virgibacillus phasianinus]
MEVPDKGDLVFLNFNPQSGHEQAGHRPAIVLSPQIFNQATKFAIICPITRQAKGYPFEVELPDGLDIGGVILTDQIRSLDWKSRGLKIRGHASAEVVEKCIKKIHAFLPL